MIRSTDTARRIPKQTLGRRWAVDPVSVGLRSIPCPPHPALSYGRAAICRPPSQTSALADFQPVQPTRALGESQRQEEGRSQGGSLLPPCLGRRLQRRLSPRPPPRFLLLLGDPPLRPQPREAGGLLLLFSCGSPLCPLVGFLAVPSLVQPIPCIKFSLFSIFRAFPPLLIGP